MKKYTSFSFSIIFTLFLLYNCDTDKLSETPLNQFEGVWELQGRKMFDGIQIKISLSKDSDKLVGNVVKSNDNKFVNMLVDSGDIWIPEITRKSNFQFNLIEKKIGSQLFGLYNLPTSTDFKVQFIDKDLFGLSSNNSNPEKSSIIYKRVK